MLRTVSDLLSAPYPLSTLGLADSYQILVPDLDAGSYGLCQQLLLLHELSVSKSTLY